jgi:ATP-dependent helicase/nuclease subunit A
MSQPTLSIVTAGAGSGKTWRITQDIKREVLENGVPPAGLLATTFTRKAAAELQLRVQTALIAARQGETALAMQEALLGTVNSVCGRLLAEFAFEAGISPDLTVLDETGEAEAFAIAFGDAAGTAEDRIAPVAFRLGLAGEANGGDWHEPVRKIVSGARANRLDAAALRMSETRSLAGVLEMLSTPDPAGAAALDAALDQAMTRLLAVAAKWDLDAEKKNTLGALETVRAMRPLFAPQEARFLTWADWAALATLGPAVARKAAFAAVIEAAAAHDRHPRLHADITTMLSVCYETAETALALYADYKRKAGLIDFTDQETILLDLLEANADISAELGQRLHTLFVDEFQDTSPLQLALFLHLGALAKRAVWVGDPKQAIYGFRGTDPALMDAVLRSLGGKQDKANILSTSRRSRPDLVYLVNSIFVPAFSQQGMPAVVVALTPHRADHAGAGPALQVWRLPKGAIAKRLEALAAQIARLLAADERPLIQDPQTGQPRHLRAGDVAVLCRDNKSVAILAAALGKRGLEVAAARGGLLETPEVSLALACLRRLADPRDNLAEAEIVHLASGDGAWLDKLLAKRPLADVRVAALDALQADLSGLPPSAALEVALSAAEIMPLLARWPSPRQRLVNIEALFGEAKAYEDTCNNLHRAATVGGFVAWLGALPEAPSQPASQGGDAVTLLTYHKAKGLEWPLVVMAQTDKEYPASAFKVSVETEGDELDPATPLAGRWVRYWPWPYAGRSKDIPMKTREAASPELAAATTRSARENVRLGYVGMTRARDVMVLALDPGTPAWLEGYAPGFAAALQQLPVGKGELTYNEVSLPVFAVDVAEADEAPLRPVPKKVTTLPWPVGPRPVFPPLRLTPSAAEGDVNANTEVIELGPRMRHAGGAARDEVGDALHRFLAADEPSLENADRLAMAKQLLAEVTGDLTSDDCLEAADRFWHFIRDHYGAEVEIIREWPIECRLENGQEVHGRTDCLIRHASGVVLIDHKSYPGRDPAVRALHYLPQLLIYKQVLEAEWALPVTAMAVHFPVLGKMVLVTP